MNEIEKILKDNMEDYESVKRQALKFIYENKKELSKNYAYAEVCGNPVDASHFFFLIDEKKPGSDLLLEMLDALSDGLNTSIIGRAIANNLLTIEAVNIRDFAVNKHNRVDDYTYGGGAGMLMQAEPVYLAYKSVEEKCKKAPRVIYLSPQGQTFSQEMAEEFANEEELVFLCGHYEGIDERVLEEIVTDYVSIGDYVLTGGELPSMVMIDAISRLIPGVLHNNVSAEFETFQDNLLEYPQYTRPEEWRGKKVPEILLSGHHANIEKWRREQSVLRTAKARPDLLEKAELTEKEKKMLANS